MKIAFTGDVVFHAKFDGMEENEKILDDNIISFLKETDFCVCDLEGPVYSGEMRTDKVAIRSKPSIRRFLSMINGNVLFLGNNHILDYDEPGFNETLAFADKNGLLKFGAGKNISEASTPLYLGDTCGLLGIRYNNKHARAGQECLGCLIWDEDEIIQKRIEEIKKQCRWCILVIHGGDEFCVSPFPEIRNRYKKFLDWGADIIVAHHPHVVQNYEIINEKIIFYSLGNFVFDDDYMRTFPEAKDGVLVKLDLSDDGYSWDFLPIYIDGNAHQIQEAKKPHAFNCIAGEADYIEKAKAAMRDFLHKEIVNLKYQYKRKDIKTKAKLRIIASHIKRFILLKKKAKALLSQ